MPRLLLAAAVAATLPLAALAEGRRALDAHEGASGAPAAVAQDLVAAGATRVELEVGPSQVRVEADGRGRSVEAVLDRGTRELLAVEGGRADPGAGHGITIGRSDDDFVEKAHTGALASP